MQLSDFLRPEAVKVVHGCSSKKRLFHDLGGLTETAYNLDPVSVVDALVERENLGPTGVGHGVALPHARLPNIAGIHGVFMRLENPLDFSAVDRQPIDLVFALIAPEDAGVEHLKALALVSRTLRDNATCSKLRSNDDPAILYSILTEHEATRAA